MSWLRVQTVAFGGDEIDAVRRSHKLHCAGPLQLPATMESLMTVKTACMHAGSSAEDETP